MQLISRAARLLRALDGEPEGLSLAEIAERVDLPRSSVHRLVIALELEGFVVPASPSGRVRLGAELMRLGENGRQDLQQELRPIMEQLFESLTETVDLAVLEGDHLRFIDQVAAPHRLRAVSAIGGTFPLHCTANGKAVLALIGDEAALGLLPDELPRFTPHTITTRSTLLRQLEEVRACGLAVDAEEHTEGITAMGFAVRKRGSAPATISVPVPTTRWSRNRRAIEQALHDARGWAEETLARD